MPILVLNLRGGKNSNAEGIHEKIHFILRELQQLSTPKCGKLFIVHSLFCFLVILSVLNSTPCRLVIRGNRNGKKHSFIPHLTLLPRKIIIVNLQGAKWQWTKDIILRQSYYSCELTFSRISAITAWPLTAMVKATTHLTCVRLRCSANRAPLGEELAQRWLLWSGREELVAHRPSRPVDSAPSMLTTAPSLPTCPPDRLTGGKWLWFVGEFIAVSNLLYTSSGLGSFCYGLYLKSPTLIDGLI